jgi:hypothetical protein
MVDVVIDVLRDGGQGGAQLRWGLGLVGGGERVHRAAEQDEKAVTTWMKETWPGVKPPRRPRMPGSASRTKRARI